MPDCPKCKSNGPKTEVERLPAVLHIPARILLRCDNCAQVFYTKDEDATDQT